MSLHSDMALRILYQTIEAEIGLAVGVFAPGTIAPTSRAKQLLYRFKRENDIFRPIKIWLSPDEPDGEIWVLREGV